MVDEIVLAEQRTTLARGFRSKNGRALLTTQRFLFFDERFDANIGFAVGGPLAGAISERLQRRHEAGGPLLDVPIAALASVERAKKGMDRNVLVLHTRDGEEHRFIGLYEIFGPALQQAGVPASGDPG